MTIGIQNRHEQAEADFLQHLGGSHSVQSVQSLWTGLTTLRKQLLQRLHRDVEAHYGVDPLLVPSTFSETQREMRHAAGEIEIYSLIVVMAEVTHSGYANGQLDWFREWLLRLRWGNELSPAVIQRWQMYEPHDDNHRRHMFASLVEQALPEATKAPLIIYRLYPRSVRVATAIAFQDTLRAREVRSEQISFLPVIADCNDCHGLPLDNGVVCPRCGNPLWKINWLNSTV